MHIMFCKHVTIHVNKNLSGCGPRITPASRLKSCGGPFNRFASPLVRAIRYADAHTRLRYTLSGSTDL